MCRILSALLLSLYCIFRCGAQDIHKEDYFVFDRYAEAAGPMKEMSLGSIVDSVTAQATTELQMLRSIYAWEAKFISFDCKAWHHPAQEGGTASAALIQREATAEGYARLFKAMCDLKHIRCEVISGTLRNKNADIGIFNKEARHYWNIVQVENTRFLVDVSLASGETDEKVRHFTRRYTDAWWLSTRLSFALSHFPDNASAQLLEIPVTRNEFTQAPLVHFGAFINGLLPGKALKGTLRGREDTAVQIRCNVLLPDAIHSVSLSYDNGPVQPAEFSADEFGLLLTLPYGPAGEHNLDVLVNDKRTLTFRTEARKVARKK